MVSNFPGIKIQTFLVKFAGSRHCLILHQTHCTINGFFFFPPPLPGFLSSILLQTHSSCSSMHKYIPRNRNPLLIFVILVFDLRIPGFGFGFGFSVFVGLGWQFWITDLKILCLCVWVFWVCSYGLELGLWWRWICVVGGGIDDWKFFVFVGVVDGWNFFWLRFIFYFVAVGGAESGGFWVCNGLGRIWKREEKMDADSNYNPCVATITLV